LTNANNLYEEIMKKIGEKKVSEFVDSNSVVCALVTKNNNVFYGSNLQASCGLSMCAEKIAIGNAVMANDTDFKYILCVFKDGSIITPCGSCRELLAQMGKQNLEMEIITQLNPIKTIKLQQLISNWWGNYRY